LVNKMNSYKHVVGAIIQNVMKNEHNNWQKHDVLPQNRFCPKTEWLKLKYMTGYPSHHTLSETTSVM
jgi:hypothetical protein